MKKKFLTMNLQFFAEPQPTDESPDNPQPTEGNNEPQLSVEEQLQQLRIENAKLKKAKDTANSEASNWKKKYNATLSDAEKLANEKAEREAEKDAELERLRKESAVSKFEKNFLGLGYTPEQAKQAAEAQYSNDTDTLFTVQQQAQQTIIKAKEAEWLKTRPEVNAGVGTGKDVDPFLAGFNS